MDFNPETTRMLLGLIEIVKNPTKLEEVLKQVEEAHKREAAALETLNAATKLREEALGKHRDAETMMRNMTNCEANLVERENALGARKIELDRVGEELAARKKHLETISEGLAALKESFEKHEAATRAEIESTLAEAKAFKQEYESKIENLKKITHGG